MALLKTFTGGLDVGIITPGDDMVEKAVDGYDRMHKKLAKMEEEGMSPRRSDVVVLKEGPTAIAQGNFVTLEQFAKEFREKTGGGHIVYTGKYGKGLSRNRNPFDPAIAMGADKITTIFNIGRDEFGNTMLNAEQLKELNRMRGDDYTALTAEQVRRLVGPLKHQTTENDYAKKDEQWGDVLFAWDPLEAAKLLGGKILLADVDERKETKAELGRCGINNVWALDDFMCEPAAGQVNGFNREYGALGANMYHDNMVKLVPHSGDQIVAQVRERIQSHTGITPEASIVGDGCFMPKKSKINELWDPECPLYSSPFLNLIPVDVKMKATMPGLIEKHNGNLAAAQAEFALIVENKYKENLHRQGTTPNASIGQILGSLADLQATSGDLGTSVVLIKGKVDERQQDIFYSGQEI